MEESRAAAAPAAGGDMHVDPSSPPKAPSALSPSRIAPRSLLKLVATWDAAREKDLIALAVKEAISTIKHYAAAEKWSATERLYELLNSAGSTRRKASVMNLKEAVSIGSTVEGEIAKWESLDRRCDALLAEIDEFDGLFPDRYQVYLKGLIEEVAAAQWDLGHPHDSPWDTVKSIFMDAAEVSALAADDVAAQHQQGTLSAKEVAEWSTAPSRRPTEHVSTARKLNVSCVAVDNTEAALTTIVVGTTRGDVISFPIQAVIQAANGVQLPADGTCGGTMGGLGATLEQSMAAAEESILMGVDGPSKPSPTSSTSTAAPPLAAPSLAQTIQQLLQIRYKAVREGATALEQLSPAANGVRVYQGHQFEVLDLTIISYNGADYEALKLVVSCSMDKVVRVSNLATGALVGLYSDSTAVVPNAQYFPMMNCLIQGSYNGSVEAWDFRTSTLVMPILQLEQPVTCVHLFASIPPLGGSAAKTAANAAAAAAASSMSGRFTPGSTGGGGAGAAAPSGPGMFVGTRKGHIYKVRFNMVEIDGSEKKSINSHSPVTFECGFLGDPLAPLPPELSPVQKDTATNPAMHRNSSASTVFTPYPSITDQSSVYIGINQASEASTSLASSPMHSRPGTRDNAGGLLAKQGSVARAGGGGGGAAALPTLVQGGHMYSVTKLATLGPFLFSADVSGKIIQWDHERRTFVHKFHSHTDTITSLVVTGDGFLFSSSRDGLVCVWSVTTGHLLTRLNRHFNVVAGIVLGIAPAPPKASKAKANWAKAKAATLLEPAASMTAAATPANASLAAPPAAAGGKKAKAAPGGTAPPAAGMTSTSSSGSLNNSRKKLQPATKKDTQAKSFPEVPMAFRKAQHGARDLVTLDPSPSALGGGGGGAAAAVSKDTLGGRVVMLSFAQDESAILWDVFAERPEMGSTVHIH